MEAIKITKGKKFIQKGDRVKNLYVLLQGNIQASYKTEKWDMEAGSIIGMLECNSDTYICEYKALSDCVLYSYDYTEPEDFVKIFNADSKYVSVFVMAAMRQTAFFLKRYGEYYEKAQDYYSFLMKVNQEYERFCEDYRNAYHSFKRIEYAKPFVPEQQINQCMVNFYDNMAGMSLRDIEAHLKRNIQLGVGEILNGTEWMNKALNLIESIREYMMFQKEILISAEEDNLYQRYFELTAKAANEGMNITPLKDAVFRIMDFAQKSQLYSEEWLKSLLDRYENYDFDGGNLSEEQAWEETMEEDISQINFLDQILNYVEYEEKKAEEFQADILQLRNLTDIYSTTDEIRALRRRLTKAFFDIYKLAFKKTLEYKNVPKSIKMFLNFGFMDAELAGESVTKDLSDIVEKLSLCKAENVYTIYEWLLSIYEGKNEPSRNEFDLDYPAYLNELKKTGRITAEELKNFTNDAWKKVEFEIENMFMSTNRLTQGKISSYCPILCEYDIINSVENMLVTAEKINEALNYIRTIDFSIFYRKVVFSDVEHEINMELIEKEVFPNVILMPNVGNRAMMWQETAGAKKDTPARFMFPILTVANITEVMIEVAGKYRWEICRKIQGVRWNDITDPSLTSEYNDYIQYYKKNHELSAEVKEKIKNTLYKCKNNFREVFVKDYQSWINYESKGSFRLNKVSRELLFKYCPFSKNIRERLKINPMYQEFFERYDIMNERAKRRIDLLYERYTKKGGEITKELQDNRDFYEL